MLHRNFSLRSYNSFGLDVAASYFVQINDLSDLEDLYKSDLWKRERKLILGGGSNTLFLDDYFEGLVLWVNNKGISLSETKNDMVRVSVAAGEDWPGFVQQMLNQGLGGLENLSLIPGKVGASPIQNIGAYGVEVKDVFQGLLAFDMETGVIVDISAKECDFGYRSSAFKTVWKNRFLIISVDFLLSTKPQLKLDYGAIRAELLRMGVREPGIREVGLAVSNIRRSKLPDPSQLGNAGSFFKNPVVHQLVFNDLKQEFTDIVGHPDKNQTVKLSAAWLIERAGWKNRRKGNVGVFQHQALVIVNFGNATGREIFGYAMEIQHSVKEMFGIELEPEVNFV